MSVISESVTQSFNPPPGLRNRHVQSMLGAWSLRGLMIRRRLRGFAVATQKKIIVTGDGTRLLALINAPQGQARSIVVMLHGWEGSAESTYMLAAAAQLSAAGALVYRLNFRDHGGTAHLNEGLFHSCRLAEVNDAVRQIADQHADLPLSLTGFSLGGNFALRVAACAPTERAAIRRVVAICPVLSPPKTMVALEEGLWVYRAYFLRRWRRSLLAKATAFPDLYQFGNLDAFPTLTETTRFFVENYTEFDSLADYLDGYSIIGERLASLEVDSLLIATQDDPVIPAADLRFLARPPSLHVDLLTSGGHCGLLHNYRLASWLDASLADLLLQD